MSNIGVYLVLNKKNYFAIADEYIELHSRFKTDTYYETLNVFMKLLGNLLLSILFRSSPMSIALSLYQTVQVILEYIRYLDMKQQIREWKEIVHSIGGPFISTNDETYQSYVYADGIQRLHNNLFGFTKERAKRL